MMLMALRVERVDGAEHRIVLKPDRLVGAQGEAELGARLEFPVVLAVRTYAALERRVENEGKLAYLSSEDGSDLVSPTIFCEARTRVSDLVREAKVQRKVPAVWDDSGDARAIADVLKAGAVAGVGDGVETSLQPAGETGADLDRGTKRVVGGAAFGVVE